MKACSKHRKHIAWLALGELDVQHTRVIREHLESCAACRRYFERISSVAQSLSAASAGQDIHASESFHQRVTGKLRASGSQSVLEILTARLRQTRFTWRSALAAMGTAVVLVALFIFVLPPRIPGPTKPFARAVAAPSAAADPAPTLASYEKVAGQSLEELDDLLTRQSSRPPSPARIYTASSPALAELSD